METLRARAERVLVDPEWIVAFVGPGVPEHAAAGLDDAHLWWRLPELGSTEIVYLSVATAQARGWLPPELTMTL